MNNLELVALQAILNRVTSAQENYEKSNIKHISEGQADQYWGEATSNIDEAIRLLKQALNPSLDRT